MDLDMTDISTMCRAGFLSAGGVHPESRLRRALSSSADLPPHQRAPILVTTHEGTACCFSLLPWFLGALGSTRRLSTRLTIPDAPAFLLLFLW